MEYVSNVFGPVLASKSTHRNQKIRLQKRKKEKELVKNATHTLCDVLLAKGMRPLQLHFNEAKTLLVDNNIIVSDAQLHVVLHNIACAFHQRTSGHMRASYKDTTLTTCFCGGLLIKLPYYKATESQ